MVFALALVVAIEELRRGGRVALLVVRFRVLVLLLVALCPLRLLLVLVIVLWRPFRPRGRSRSSRRTRRLELEDLGAGAVLGATIGLVGVGIEI